MNIRKATRKAKETGGAIRTRERHRRIEAAVYAVEAGLAILVIVAAVCYAGYVIGPLIW